MITRFDRYYRLARSDKCRQVVILLLLAGCTVACSSLTGGGGERPTATLAEQRTKVFVQALQAGDGEATCQMFSETIRPKMSPDKLALLVEQDERWAALRTYQSLQVCDWGVVMKNDGSYVLTQGLLRYQDGDVIFESTLRQDSDAVWRIYEFRLMLEMDPKPFGRCAR